ncbi:MAG TPA: cyclophilin-like fold protein [bacterium]|nr:cyclophilin-like fold protein [bacterium]HPP13175.1 cyclophilin-like fold protein [bacterium]
MTGEILIKVGSLTLKAELNDSVVAKKVWEILPVKARVSTWGEEIYFRIPLQTEINSPVTEVKKGDLGYWPDGACFCIFFGPTPVSTGDRIIPASAVEIIGKLVTDDYSGLRKVRSGAPVVLEK